jgi:hypothetical protein
MSRFYIGFTIVFPLHNLSYLFEIKLSSTSYILHCDDGITNAIYFYRTFTTLNFAL